jgi:hypothetical protein
MTTNTIKETISLHKKELTIGGFLVLLLAISIFGLYCSSSSDVSTPKADEFGRQSANAHAESVVNESDANSIAVQVGEKSREREMSREELDRLIKLSKQNGKLKELVSEYEKVINENRPVDARDLNSRERQLHTDHREHQDNR